jgi:hypothetical protein
MRTATNQAPVEETFEIVNFGAGQMFWDVSSNVSWLTFDQDNGSGDSTVVFTADPAGLPPGVYHATITIQTVPPTNAPSALIVETAEVEVTFVVMPEMVFVPENALFLPVVRQP